MLKSARATLPLLCAALLLACSARDPEEPTPRPDLVGVWDLVTVNGATLPTPSPEEQSVMLESIVMTLEQGGGYSLASSFRVGEPGSAQQMTIGGTWAASGDALRFESEEGPAIVEFGYSRDGDGISMVDVQGNVWGMRRR